MPEPACFSSGCSTFLSQSKLAVGVGVRINGCLSLFVGPGPGSALYFALSNLGYVPAASHYKLDK